MSASRVAMRRRWRRRHEPKGGGRGRLLFGLAGLLLLLLVAGAGVAGAGVIFGMNQYNAIADDVVPAEELIARFSRGGARIYDRNGVLMYEFVDELGGLRRPVPLAEISQSMRDATIAVEDPSFYENNGINWRGTVRAGVENFAPFLIGGEGFLEGSGGSSITQQLARNVYMDRAEREERSIARKLKEMVIAVELTERYPKDQILEWYLNSISYGGIYTGIQAASEGYFGKPASQLTLAEASMLAGIPQSPAVYNPFSPANLDPATGRLSPTSLTKARQAEVLDLMVRRGVISEAEADRALATPLVFRQSRFEIEAPHFVLGRVADEITARFGERALYEQGLEVVTTIDLELQHIAEQIIETYVTDYGEQANLFNGAFVALDPKTGQLLVYVGSRDYFRDDIEGRNDNAVALNSPGSTLKPFTFMTAFMKGWGTGAGIIDAPFEIVDFATGDAFSPRNPIQGYQGPMTAASALGNSLNITAIKAIIYAGVPETINTLKRVGYTTLDNPLGYGPALTTGGGEITLLDQVIGYSVLATNGVMRGQEALVTPALDPGERTLEPIALLKVTDPDGKVLYEYQEPLERQVIAPEYAYLVTSVLSDGRNQCITYGVCNALALPNGYPSAAKTGTSEPFEDSREIGETWTLGYTPELVAGVWAGNADNAPIVGITSTSVSLRAWKEFMVQALEYLEAPRTAFTRPPGVVEREVCWPSGMLPTELCPAMNRYKSLYAAEVIPSDPDQLAALQDTWWQQIPIDTRTGQRATPLTPAQFVRSEVRLVLPKDEIEKWGDGLLEWAARFGVTALLAPPEEETPGPLVVRVDTPAPSGTIAGVVEIRGRAASDDFVRYTVEWGRGASPSSWVRLNASIAPVTNGLLGTWDTLAVPNGDYTIRVSLLDRKLGLRSYRIPVRVDNGALAPEADVAPVVILVSPQANTQVSGRVTVQGTAASPGAVQVRLEASPGVNPGSFTTVSTTAGSVISGTIGTWDTTDLPDGPYTLRVVLVDQFFGDTAAEVLVIVKNEKESN